MITEFTVSLKDVDVYNGQATQADPATVAAHIREELSAGDVAFAGDVAVSPVPSSEGKDYLVTPRTPKTTPCEIAEYALLIDNTLQKSCRTYPRETLEGELFRNARCLVSVRHLSDMTSRVTDFYVSCPTKPN